ncbi:MAG: molybdopterin-synthase adenylyltransferase MoeB [Acidobacteriota bacterium]
MSIETLSKLAEQMTLEPDEIRRYGRHLTLPEFGLEAQKRLKASRVLMVGAGGLGSPLGLYLAAAGVGTLGLVEFDRVDVSNLQRQVLYGFSDVGRPKIEAAMERLREINPLISLVPHPCRLDESNAAQLIDDYDVVVDGSDNFPTRYLVNDACVLAAKPNVWGAISRFEGQVSVFWQGRGPCYRCLFPEPPPPGLVPSCAEGGVLGVLPGIVGSLQANEVIKLLAGIGEPLIGRLMLFDALRMRSREIALASSPECPLCGDHPTIRSLVAYSDAPCETDPNATSSADPAGRPPSELQQASMSQENSMPQAEETPFEIDVEQFKKWLDEGLDVQVLDVREPMELELCRIEGSIHIPMRQIPERLEELDREALTVVHCHHGPRSSQVVAYLRQQGLARVTNLDGGIDAWSARIDPSVPRY